MRKGQAFAPLLIILGAVLFVYLWAKILPEMSPIFTDSISSIQGGPNADGTEFFIRMYPWAIPLIVVLGLLYRAVFRKTGA